MEFVIPLNAKDLLEAADTSQYVVDEIFPVKQIGSVIMGCRTAIRREGYSVMVSEFDCFYSLINHFKNVESEMRDEALDCAINAVTNLVSSLSGILEHGDIDSNDKAKKRNAVKMIVYILCRLTEALEAHASKPSIDIVSLKKKGKRKKTQTSTTDWEGQREKVLQSLVQLLQLDLSRLWEPPVVEEEFVNLVSGLCYKLLENPEVTKIISTKDILIHVIAILIKRYNHALSASLKILQLLQHFEHLTSPLAQAIHVMVTHFGLKSIVGEVIRELGSLDSQDLARDNSGTKAYAAFISELSELIPDAILPSISLLLTHLEGESYTMRNGVFVVIGNIITKILTGDGLNDKSRSTRDKLLDHLEDHIHDVNAFCRSRTLQVWLNLSQHRAVPLARQQTILELTVGRLHDKSSIVRKSAMQLLTALLTGNPFAAKLPVADLEASVTKEKEKLDALMPKDQNVALSEEIEEQWAAAEKELRAVLEEMKNPENSQKDPVQIDEDKNKDSVHAEIKELLLEGKFIEAIQLLQVAEETWPDEVFENKEKEEDGEADETADVESKDDAVVASLKSIFTGQKGLPSLDVLDMESLQHLAEVGLSGGSDASVANVPVNDLTKQQVLVRYLEDCVGFAKLVQKAVPVICELLVSKSTSDILEAIEFFVSAYEFGVTISEEGVRRMLILVWTKEQSVKEAVVGAYRRLYLNPDGPSIRARSLSIIRNLMALTAGATLGQLTSLEELVCEFVRGDELPKQVFQILWEIFTGKHPDHGPADARIAVKLLGMAGGADLEIIKSNVEVLVSVGLGEQAEQDFMLAKETCVTLSKLAGSDKPKATSKTGPFRLPMEHDIFSRLAEILVGGLSKIENKCWIPLAEEAINVIFSLAEHPDLISGDIIKRLATSIMADQGEDSKDVDSAIMSRFVALVGHVALKSLVFLDVYVLTELKRRRNLKEKEDENNKKKKTKSQSKENEEGDIEDEMGLAGATADDAEAEFMRKVCETDVISGTNLLATIRPLIVHICSSPSKYSDPSLQAAASLALAKFMLISSEVCDQHLQLLFTILEKSPHPTIRANTIIAMGDLTFRFPNLIEPWTPNLYARLRDDSILVRKNTLLVLTHLILNDMVKVKGQISEMAFCIVDSEERLSSLAKLFFFELSKKGNAIYNIMPDIISRLSDPDIGLPEEQFQIILRYLFAFIQKDRQAESLVEKLCHRFRAARSDRQARQLAFCLSMLNFNEKSLRKLQENFACYAERLADKEIYDAFVTILNKTKKFIKPETKALFEDYESKLLECHQKGVSDEAAADKANKASAAASKVQKGRKTSDDGEEKENEAKTPMQVKTTPRNGATTGRKRQNKKAAKTPKNDKNALDESIERSMSGKKGRPKRRVPAPIAFSSDEGEDSDDVFNEPERKIIMDNSDEESLMEEKDISKKKAPSPNEDTPQTGRSSRRRRPRNPLSQRNRKESIET